MGNDKETELHSLSTSIPPTKLESESRLNGRKPKMGLVVGSAFGITGICLVALTTPFVLPAVRTYCLPYVPATNRQLSNLSRAFKRHAQPGSAFLDIGSGDGRICRLASRGQKFSLIHGVELNYILVLFSRILSIRDGQFNQIKYFHRDLWQFNLGRYDSICIFGVESLMEPLERRLKEYNKMPQTIMACRFPFKDLLQVDKIGKGIDTVWVYKLGGKNQNQSQ